MPYDALATFIKKRVEFSKNEGRTHLESVWAKSMKDYSGYVDPKTPGHTKLKVPVIFSHSFRLYAAIGSQIQQNPDICTYVPYPRFEENDLDASSAGEKMQQASNFYLTTGHANQAILNTLHEAVVMGTSFCKCTWEVEQEDVQEVSNNPFCPMCGSKIVAYSNVDATAKCQQCGLSFNISSDGHGGIVKNYTEKTKDGAKFEHRPVKNIYFDPKVMKTSATVSDMEWLVDERYVSFDSLKGNKKFSNLSLVRDAGREKSSAEETGSELDQVRDQINGSTTSGVELRDQNSDQVLLQEFYGKIPRTLLDEKKKDFAKVDLKDFIDGHVILANGICIYADLNPYGRIPYAVCRCYKNSETFHGIGIPLLLKDLSRNLNGIVNQRMDNVSLALNRMWKARTGRVNPKSIKSSPGGIIWLNDMTDLEPFNTPDVTAGSYQEQAQLYDLCEKTDGMAEVFFGDSSSHVRKSATAVSLETELGAGIIQRIVADMVQDFFIPLMEIHRDNILTFMEEPITLMSEGKPLKITYEEIDGKYELVPSIGEQMFTRSAELQKQTMLIGQTMQMAPMLVPTGYKIDFGKLLTDLYKIAGRKDYKAIISKLEGANGQEGQGGPSQLFGALQGIAGGQGANGGMGGPVPNGVGDMGANQGFPPG
jgi:hypothetical protein